MLVLNPHIQQPTNQSFRLPYAGVTLFTYELGEIVQKHGNEFTQNNSNRIYIIQQLNQCSFKRKETLRENCFQVFMLGADDFDPAQCNKQYKNGDYECTMSEPHALLFL